MPLSDYSSAEQWSFGNSPDMADELLTLVIDGRKTATCSALAGYHDEDEPIPEAGLIDILLDGKNQPRCAIRTVLVEQIPFAQVSAEFAYAEGEGDRSLEYWRQEHEHFFKQTTGFSPDMIVVCQWFEVIEIF